MNTTTYNFVKKRDDLYKLFDGNRAVVAEHRNMGFDSDDSYSAYCIAMSLLQDSGEALLVHRKRGFSHSTNFAYLELIGILQTLLIHKDALRELNFSLFNNREPCQKKADYPAWYRLRETRHLVAGHPNHMQGAKSCSVVRGEISYSKIVLCQSKREPNKLQSLSRFQNLELGKELESYDTEAGRILDKCTSKLRSRFQKQNTPAISDRGASNLQEGG